VSRTGQFCALGSAQADALFEHFAWRAILTRRISELGMLRFGLPGRETDWQRLERAIAEWEPRA
jgi:cobalamin biosynthesis protein CobC